MDKKYESYSTAFFTQFERQKAAKIPFSGGKSGARGPKKIARRASGPWDEARPGRAARPVTMLT